MRQCLSHAGNHCGTRGEPAGSPRREAGRTLRLRAWFPGRSASRYTLITVKRRAPYLPVRLARADGPSPDVPRARGVRLAALGITSEGHPVARRLPPRPADPDLALAGLAQIAEA